MKTHIHTHTHTHTHTCTHTHTHTHKHTNTHTHTETHIHTNTWCTLQKAFSNCYCRTSMVKQDSTGAMVNWHQVIRDPRLWTPQNVQILQQIYTKHNPVMRCGNPDAQTPFRPPVCTIPSPCM